jgi:hypothetical protein
MTFACKSVLGGWQTVMRLNGTEYLIGPTFNASTDLWAWQRAHLPNC